MIYLYMVYYIFTYFFKQKNKNEFKKEIIPKIKKMAKNYPFSHALTKAFWDSFEPVNSADNSPDKPQPPRKKRRIN